MDHVREVSRANSIDDFAVAKRFVDAQIRIQIVCCHNVREAAGPEKVPVFSRDTPGGELADAAWTA